MLLIMIIFEVLGIKAFLSSFPVCGKGEHVMSCFGCCAQDNVPKAAASGPYKASQSTGGFLCWTMAYKDKYKFRCT